jgi:type I restriction enzyme S subunit
MAIRVKKWNSDFVYYYLEHHNSKYEEVAEGLIPGITREDVLQTPILIPPLPEQRKIAEILSTWDQAISLVDQRIEAAQHRKKGLMQRLLTGGVRFPEFEGEDWREVKLGKVFDERKEQGYDDLPLLSITAEEGIIYRDELDRRDTSSSDKSDYLRVCEGDVAYNTMRMWQGRSGVSDYEGIVSPAYTVCEPEPEIDVNFVGYLFQLPSIIYKFRRYSQGMVSDTWTLRYDNFADIEVQIPGLDEQERIAEVLQTCDREIELLEQKRDALQRQKKGLMQRLLTGRVRVSV